MSHVLPILKIFSQNIHKNLLSLKKTLESNLRICFSYNLSITEIIRKNIFQFFPSAEGFYSIKMDEIALTQRIRWLPNTNEIIGFCYNHKHEIFSFEFDNFISINQIESKYKENNIHVANDALVVTLCPLSKIDTIPRPIIIFPLCCHRLFEIKNVVQEIINIFNDINPKGKICNIATDGDPFRRKLLNNERELSKISLFNCMPIFSNRLLYGYFGINFDVKHLIKRIRGIIISEKRDIRLVKRSINKSHVKRFLQNLTSLLNIHDKQNVPFAVELLSGLQEIKNVKLSQDKFHIMG